MNLVAHFEGFFSCPYNDPVGYATIGFGHLIGYRRVTRLTGAAGVASPARKRKRCCEKT